MILLKSEFLPYFCTVISPLEFGVLLRPGLHCLGIPAVNILYIFFDAEYFGTVIFLLPCIGVLENPNILVCLADSRIHINFGYEPCLRSHIIYKSG